MLREIKGIRTRESGPGRRRWFNSDAFDLVLWQEPHGGIERFQLAIRDGSTEHALTWTAADGCVFNRVDDGETRNEMTKLRYKMSPILLPNGDYDCNEIAKLFEAESGQIDPAVTQFVITTLRASPAKS